MSISTGDRRAAVVTDEETAKFEAVRVLRASILRAPCKRLWSSPSVAELVFRDRPRVRDQSSVGATLRFAMLDRKDKVRL